MICSSPSIGGIMYCAGLEVEKSTRMAKKGVERPTRRQTATAVRAARSCSAGAIGSGSASGRAALLRRKAWMRS